MANSYFAASDPAVRLTTARAQPLDEFNQAVADAFDMVPAPAALQGNAIGYCGTSSGEDGAYTVTTPTPWPTIAVGQEISFLANHENPGASTIVVNGAVALSIRDSNGAVLTAGAIPANSIVKLVRNTGYWQQVLGSGGGSGSTTIEVTEVSADSEVIRPEDYALGSDALNIAAAITAGMSTGTPVRLDGNYSLSAALSTFSFTGSEKLTVIGAGTINITADFTSPVFTFHATYTTPTSVSSVTQTTRTFPGGDTASIATRITSASHGCSVGDLIKIVSDDQIAPSTSSSHRMGEFAYVADVSGNDIYVSGYLLNAYSTTIRITRVRTAPKFRWDGPTFSATAAQSSWDTFGIRVRGFLHPFLRTGMQDGYDVVAEFSSCMQGEAHITFRNLRNRVDSEGVSGYGFQDACSQQSMVYIRGVDTRHGYTTVTNTSSTNDEPYLYGQTVGSIVSGVIEAGSSASFDTHTESVDVTFANCSTSHARQGESGAGSAVQLRGLRSRAINLVDRFSNNGVSFKATSAGDCVDCELVNFNYVGAGKPIRINEAAGSDNVTRPKVKGGYVRTSGQYSVQVWDCDGGVIDDLLLAPNGSTNGSVGILLGGDAEVIVRRLTIDLSGYTGTQYRPFQFDSGSTDNTLIVDSCRVINASGKLQFWFKGNSATGSATFGDLRTDAEPSGGDFDTTANLTLTVEEDDITTQHVLVDDFYGTWAIGDAGPADTWSTTAGAGTGNAVATTVAGSINGEVTLKSASDDGTHAQNFSTFTGINTGWKANQGGLSVEARIKLSAVSTAYLFVGFTDTISTTVEGPIYMNGADIDSDATNACGLVYDADATTDVFYVGGVKADVDTSPTSTAIAPSANTYVILKVSVDTSGSVTGYINGAAFGPVANAVTASTSLTPAIVVGNRSAAQITATIDYIKVTQNR